MQVMYLVLHGVKRMMCRDGLHRVCVPHGAESGFDPYQAYKNLDEDSVLGYIHGKLLARDSPGEWVSLAACATSPGWVEFPCFLCMPCATIALYIRAAA